MKIALRIRADILDAARTDLRRPHPFAAERVGFLIARPARSAKGLILLVSRYDSVPDDGYTLDLSVGAMMNETTILGAMQKAYTEKVSILHVHSHGFFGRPSFSRTDLRESARFVQSFVNVRPEYPHGAMVLSDDSATGRCWLPGGKKPSSIDTFAIVGKNLRKIVP
jgi:hypothetical protein